MSSAPACRVSVEYCGACGFEPKYQQLKVSRQQRQLKHALTHSLIHKLSTAMRFDGVSVYSRSPSTLCLPLLLSVTLCLSPCQSYLESEFPGQLRSVTGEEGRTGSFEVSIISQHAHAHAHAHKQHHGIAHQLPYRPTDQLPNSPAAVRALLAHSPTHPATALFFVPRTASHSFAVPVCVCVLYACAYGVLVWCVMADYGGQSFLLYSKLSSGGFPSNEYVKAAVAQFIADGTVKGATHEQAAGAAAAEGGNKCTLQ